MKDLSLFVSVGTLVILLGYITYRGGTDHVETGAISDEEVALDKVEQAQSAEEPFPVPAISLDLPTEASFAGEPVPLNDSDVKERFDREIQVNTYTHSNTLFLIKRANRWLPQIDSILKKNGIPDDFKYLPLIESALINDVSPKEAVGFWQILKGSGKELGLEVTKEVDERYDPLKSTEAACKYLKQAYARFGNWTLAAASYNRGQFGLDKSVDNQQVKSYYDLYLNDETARYVFRILAIKEIIEHPRKYGFITQPGHLYNREPVRHVRVTETVKNLITFAKEQGITYKTLKRHNPWLRDEKLTVKKGKSYSIAIPL
jgi:membrane-bound lytic murein transglycosylase D